MHFFDGFISANSQNHRSLWTRSHARRGRRGDVPIVGPSGGPAAILIVIITAIMVIYILFLPPAERDKLLNNGNTGTGVQPGGTSSGTTRVLTSLLNEKVGTLTTISSQTVNHEMSSFRIFDTTQAQVLKQINSLYVKRSVLSEEDANLTFAVDPTVSKNLKLSFNVKAASGYLLIQLNGQPIATVKLDVGNPDPIVIPSELLQQVNTLSFSVSSPGIMFWDVNEYLLQPVMIVGDVTDVSGLRSDQTFSIATSEQQNLDTATLFFYPDCARNAVGPMDILVNNHRVFHGVGDCQVLNHVELATDDLQTGLNTVTFEASSGSYLIDQLKVETTLKEPVHPVYYFDLLAKYFGTSTVENSACGVKDGICPSNCQPWQDPDCCFNQNEFWCPTSTQNIYDRCVAFADTSQCGRCSAGYQDQGGTIPDACKNTCGDDKDGICPAGCQSWQDKDCCFSQSTDNYWCNEVPSGGSVQDKCTLYVSEGQCQGCASGYTSSNRGSFNCQVTSTQFIDQSDKLLSNYDVNLTVKFAGDNAKRLDVIINGQTISLDTSQRYYSRLIDPYVQSGSNVIELVPRTDVEVTSLSVTLRRKS